MTREEDEMARQFSAINKAMGGVVNSLQTMGKQVNNLNMIAGNVLQGVQDQTERSRQVPQILIEVRRAPAMEDDAEEHQTISPEDMSPEMLEKFRTFQAVYHAIVHQQKQFPSRKRPDQN